MTRRSAVKLLVSALAVGLLGGPASAVAGASDGSATTEYLAANSTLVKTAKSYLRRAEAAPLGLLAVVKRECPQAAAKSPQSSQSGQLSDEVIGAMVISAYHLNVAGLKRFVGRVEHLRWSNRHLTREVRIYSEQLEALAVLRPPNVCADVRSWAASGYKTVPPNTIAFDKAFLPAWVRVGYLPSGLGSYETPAERSIAKHSYALELELIDGEARAVESWGKILDELELEPE
jgi:hypothetical protein